MRELINNLKHQIKNIWCKIKKLKELVSGIQMGASLAYLNGTMFSTLPYYNDQADAQSHNAIPNTFYLKSGGVIAMVTNY